MEVTPLSHGNKKNDKSGQAARRSAPGAAAPVPAGPQTSVIVVTYVFKAGLRKWVLLLGVLSSCLNLPRL
jgi:hypothetical protein